jgi:hypothetical protein
VVEVAVGQVRVRVVATALRPALVLAALVGLNLAVRVPLVFHRATPRYFPDEYLYSELARSFARSGDLRVLDASSSLPSVLAPVLQSLAWLPGDAELAFRLTQALHVVVMSLAIVPVYLIARRLGVRTGLALTAAAFAIVCPDLVFAGYVTADAIGYTLALVAVHAALRALAVPTVAAQAWLVVACAAATAIRTQYVLLLPATAAASLVIARRRPLRAVRELWLVWALVGLGAVAVAAAGAGALGRYGTLASAGVSADGLTWLPVSAYLLALAVGAAVVPGAVAWISCELARPSTRPRVAFAALFALSLAGLATAAAVMSVHTGSDRFFERYLMIGVPLLGVAFACWLEAGRPGRRIALATAALVVLAATQVPVAAYAEGQGRADSPLLLAVSWPERWLGVGTASLAVALLATIAVGIGLLGGRRGRPAPALVVSLVLMTALSAGAHAADLELSRRVEATQVATPASWVDEASVGDVLLVQTPGSDPNLAMTQAFWNASVTRGALLGERTEPMDGAVARLAVDARGRMSLHGARVTGPLLVAADGSRAIFDGASTVARQDAFSLAVPRRGARLAALAEGLAADGWLGQQTRIAVYPTDTACRTLELELSLPPGARPTLLHVSGHVRPGTVAVRPGRTVSLRAASGSTRPGVIRLTATTAQTSRPGILRLRTVQARIGLLQTPCPTTSNRP